MKDIIVRLILTSAILLIISSSFCQQIILDDSFDDWSGINTIYQDAGDASGLDLEELQIANDNVYLYIRLKINQELLLQQDNAISVVIDFDLDRDSGFDFDELGAEMYFTFGLRSGRIFGFNNEISHDDIGIISSPTVSGTEFEIAIKRKVSSFNGVTHEMTDQIGLKVFSNFFSGDELPNAGGGVVYRLSSVNQDVPEYSFQKDPASDFRFMSFNVLRDNLFDSFLDAEYQAILNTINPDIMCFQEIYDHNTIQLLNYLEDLNVIDDVSDWHAVKHGADLISISRYPIIYDERIGGNGMFVCNINGVEVAFFNNHLPCCENDDAREQEIDQILKFIRQSKEGNEDYTLAEGTPYIICGDMNFVGRSSQVNAFLQGEIYNNSLSGPDVEMDWDGDGMKDLIPQTTGFNSSFTWYSPFSSFFPGRLDYIFYTDSRLESMNQFVLNSAGLPFDEQYEYSLFENTSLDASDHMPLVADFRIKSPNKLDELSDVSYRIYPNPGNGLVHLENKEETIKIIDVYSTKGSSVLKITDPSPFETLRLPTGIYFVKMTDARGFFTSEKIIIH